ncbi:MAG: hypothetical protein K6E62_05150, partial [Lachnospiraceae bacterium]|nr:hypothetical protein [Lachnospiraceae bacterium]
MRKSTKKLVAIGLAATMSVGSLAGCSSSSKDSNSSSEASKDSESKTSDSTEGSKDADATKADPSKVDESTEGETFPEKVDNFVPPTYDPVYVPDEPVKIEIFSQVANYSGEQQGWSAQVLKDKFNVIVNIVHDPDGNQLTTRMQTGNLGDIIVLGDRGDDYDTAVKNGYFLNWNKDDLLATYGSYMNEHFADALSYNASMNDGICYGFSGSVSMEGSSNEQGIIYTWD